MAADRYGKNVVLLAYSEFGRRVQANASQGTDHGTAGPVFVAGAPVKGGFYGDEPSLTDLDNGDLKATTDFRDVYYELLSTTLPTDPTPRLGPVGAAWDSLHSKFTMPPAIRTPDLSQLVSTTEGIWSGVAAHAEPHSRGANKIRPAAAGRSNLVARCG
jgi:hypothetical protein